MMWNVESKVEAAVVPCRDCGAIPPRFNEPFHGRCRSSSFDVAVAATPCLARRQAFVVVSLLEVFVGSTWMELLKVQRRLVARKCLCSGLLDSKNYRQLQQVWSCVTAVDAIDGCAKYLSIVAAA